jgi:hypothetical protein
MSDTTRQWASVVVAVAAIGGIVTFATINHLDPHVVIAALAVLGVRGLGLLAYLRDMAITRGPSTGVTGISSPPPSSPTAGDQLGLGPLISQLVQTALMMPPPAPSPTPPPTSTATAAASPIAPSSTPASSPAATAPLPTVGTPGQAPARP